MPVSTHNSIGLAAEVVVDGTNGTPYDPIKAKLKTLSGTVLIGGADVSSSNGYTVSTTEVEVELAGDDLYAVATATATLTIFYNKA